MVCFFVQVEGKSFAVFEGGEAGAELEEFGEIVVVRDANGCGNLLDGEVGGFQKPFGFADAQGADIFADAVYDNATLYIPNGTEQLYQKREPWNLFFYIAEMDFTGIDEVLDEVKAESGKVKAIYDFQGRKVDTTNKGIYIINGKKVFVK